RARWKWSSVDGFKPMASRTRRVGFIHSEQNPAISRSHTHNPSRNGSNCVKKIINQHKSPPDIVAGYQPNTFHMLPRYHAESWLTNADNLNAKSPRMRR